MEHLTETEDNALTELIQKMTAGSGLAEYSLKEFMRTNEATMRFIFQKGIALGKSESLAAYSGEGIRQWISVGERLPIQEDADEAGNVLIYRECNDSQKLMAKSIHKWNMVKHCDKNTLWQKLPEPPK